MMKKLIVGLAGAATVAAGTAVMIPQAAAADLTTATVTSGGEGTHLNVRNEPAADASLRSTFPDGSVVELFCQTEGTPVDAGQGETTTWYAVKGGGYVTAAWLDSAPELSACGDEGAPGYEVTANGFGGSVNIRTEASGSSAIAGSLADGDSTSAACRVQGTEQTNDEGYTSDWWFRVEGGWVTEAYVHAAETPGTIPTCSLGGGSEEPGEPAPADGNYYLPFANGTTVTVTQGPYGSFSHNNPNNYHAVDIGMPEGTPLLAPAAGTVRVASDRGDGYGNVVYIDHGDNRCTQLAHMSQINVGVGQQVNPGDAVGAVGSTGMSTGAHLHWNIVACDGYVSLETPNTVESGTQYAEGATITSQNPGA